MQILKFNINTAHGLSILPTNGVKNRVKIEGGNSPIIFKNTNRRIINVQPTINVTGINSNDCETKSGTPSGIRIVKFFFLHKL